MMRHPPNFSRVAAVLGPTNTGKTHYAVERMLAHGSGVMGFPLRLLAREIYDRIRGMVGDDAVALMTGEEQVGGETARYVVATVEAMPLARRFAFLAVDEIQLCADRERGHVFTDRLLHARGEVETLFLGSDTIRPLLKQLVPEAEIITRPRFSILAHSGSAKLNRLPRRSAVVAFTSAEVYQLAELMRRQKGGAAVVLGALSPRTRNAQVALYQSGEVDHLVATDAIGMGLNMDLSHVAFAQLHKFDGSDRRRLTAAEIGQIAGRAGRHMANGTFGTTNGCGALDERIVEAVESHHFLPLRRLRWRNAKLDFTSLDDLAQSLDAEPPAHGLVKVRDALDDRSLGILSRRDDIRERARSGFGVRLLWQVCQIPDFRKTLTDAHIHLLATVFRHLTDDQGVLPADWVGTMIARLDRVDGDIDTLVTRIAHVRTWTYLSHRRQWFDDAAYWQGLARAVEDRLSDALHERLTQKFVDRRTAALLKSLRERGELAAEIEPGGDVLVDGHPVGTLDGFVFTLGIDALTGEGAADHRLFAGAARRAVTRRLNQLATELVREADPAFTLEAGSIVWRGAVVATLQGGQRLLRPTLAVTATDELALKARLAIERRLADWLDAWLDERLRPLRELEAASRSGALSAAARGIAYRLVEDLGALASEDAAELTAQLARADRRELARLGVRIGVRHLYLPALLKPAAQEALALLVALTKGGAPWRPPAGRVALKAGEWPSEPEAALKAMGYCRIGKVALRVDMVERVAARLRELARHDVSFVLPEDLPSSAGLGREAFLELLPGLGFRAVSTVVAQEDGGAARAEIRVRRAKPRRQRPSPEHRKVQARQGPSQSPFAVLAQLKVVNA